ncbi:LysR family transcriptional regulator [Frigidibacter sp. MR17.14]|uniref:LysR family transcriptional regulator n=1 Tax=Frigidibacter sp. MR17.14 TaxID=3126509 RepID=UPI003012F095
MELRNLAIFAEIATAGSLAAAGRRLGLSPMAASRGLAALETEAGARLVHRSTRSLSLTPEGEALLPHARTILDEAAAALAAIRPAARGVAGLLRVGCSAAFAHRVLLPLVPRLLAAHPDLRIEVLAGEGLVDLTAEGLDIAIRHADLPDSSLIARRLARSRRLLCAAPDYLARCGRPTTRADLAGHECLRLSGVTHWGFADGLRVPVAGRFAANTFPSLHDACLAGLGIAVLADWNVAPDLQAGRLEALDLVDAAPEPRDVWAVYPSRRGLTPRVRLLIDTLAARMPGGVES